MKQKKEKDMLLVMYEQDDDGAASLIVGRRNPGDTAEIITLFEGDDARLLYTLLRDGKTE